MKSLYIYAQKANIKMICHSDTNNKHEYTGCSRMHAPS